MYSASVAEKAEFSAQLDTTQATVPTGQSQIRVSRWLSVAAMGAKARSNLQLKHGPERACVALRLLLAGRVGGVRPGQRNNLKRNGGAALAQHANVDGSLTRDINDVAGRGATVCYLHDH